MSASMIGILGGYMGASRVAVGKPMMTWSKTSSWSKPMSSIAFARRTTASPPSR